MEVQMQTQSTQLELFPKDPIALEEIRKLEVEKKQKKLKFFLSELSHMNKQEGQVRLAIHLCEDLEKILGE